MIFPSTCCSVRQAIGVHPRLAVEALKLAPWTTCSDCFRADPAVGWLSAPLCHLLRGCKLVENPHNAFPQLVSVVVSFGFGAVYADDVSNFDLKAFKFMPLMFLASNDVHSERGFAAERVAVTKKWSGNPMSSTSATDGFPGDVIMTSRIPSSLCVGTFTCWRKSYSSTARSNLLSTWPMTVGGQFRTPHTMSSPGSAATSSSRLRNSSKNPAECGGL